jgi:predicted ABC-type ATPase
MVHFVNADLIAGGLSPLKPQLAAIAAARMVLREIDRLAAQRVDFAFETTLSGLNYARRLACLCPAEFAISGGYFEAVSVTIFCPLEGVRLVVLRDREVISPKRAWRQEVDPGL